MNANAPLDRQAGKEPGSRQAAPQARQWARLILISGLWLFGLWILRGLLVPLVWSVILAFASWPLYRRFERFLARHRHGAAAAPALFALLVGLIFLVPLALVALEFAHDLPNLMRWVASIEEKGLTAPDWLARLPMVGSYAFDWWKINLSDPRGAVELFGRVNRGVSVYWVSSLGTELLYRLTDLLLTLLTLFFLYRHGAGLGRQIQALARVVMGDAGDRMIGHMQAAVRGAVNGLVLVGFGEGLVLGVAYAACGVPHPVVLGALTGIVAAIPFGVFVMFSLGSAILLAQASIGPAVALFGIGIVVLVAADYFVRPIVIGNAAKLPFLWVLFGIFGGLQSFGLLGLFLGPAVLACLLALWREWVEERA